MVAVLRPRGGAAPMYGPGMEEFSVEVRHGGFLHGHGNLKRYVWSLLQKEEARPLIKTGCRVLETTVMKIFANNGWRFSNRLAYVDGKVSWFDHVETDIWSPLWLDSFVEKLWYLRTGSLKFNWLVPGKKIADGLRIIETDKDTNVMAAMVVRFKDFVVYVDHGDHFGGLEWDDIVENPVPTMPKNEGKQNGGATSLAAEQRVPHAFNRKSSLQPLAAEQREEIVFTQPDVGSHMPSQMPDTMLPDMMDRDTQTSMLPQPLGPLPESGYIVANRLVPRPDVPLTTATKEGKAAAAKKRKAKNNQPSISRRKKKSGAEAAASSNTQA
ncbi:hypothetical protein EJB05_49237 [Eragrostis curvula]|uniref:PB1-like domain-containing protein n=1 Tax=Eragrostis curvula TaxID=38414 RepID=A0A5J9T3T0_9POAL|nr:hypothetical protein EJB05_49237 [Eragrostis curvula]